MFVIPAKAGTQLSRSWAPAYAGVTNFLFAIALFVLALATLLFLAPALLLSARPTLVLLVASSLLSARN